MRGKTLVAVALLAVSLLAVGTAGAVPADAGTLSVDNHTATNQTATNETATNATNTTNETGPPDRFRGVDARLSVRQPHYIEEQVRQETVDGVPRYLAAGEEITLLPTNFNDGDVINFGVVENNGQVSYDPDFSAYRFAPPGNGTYTLFWVVAQGGDTVRYRAQVQVTGGTDLTHQTAGELAATEEAAANWREFNATFHDAGLRDDGVSLDANIQEMLNWYKLHPTNNPLSALTGGAWGYIITALVVPGAALVWALWNGYHTAVVIALKRRLNRQEALEAEEGDARVAIEELRRQEHQRIAAKTDPRDVHDDDHWGAVMRETFGENLWSASAELLAAFPGRNLIAHKLRALGNAGYIGVREGEESVEIKRGTEPDSDADTVDLTGIEPGDDVLDDFDTGGLIHDFDLTELEFDADDIALDPDEYDLEELMERFEADLRHFDDTQQWGELLYEFALAVENNPLVRPDGSLNGSRWALEGIYEHAEIMGDEYQWPVFPMIRESIGQALATYDREEVVRDAIEDAKTGGAD